MNSILYTKKGKNSYLLLIQFVFIMLSCSNFDTGDNPAPSNFARPYFSSFRLLAENNKELSNDYDGKIIGDSLIVLLCPELDSSDSIVPAFDGVYDEVTVGGKRQISYETALNFNNTQRYELTDKNGNKSFYNVQIKVFNCIPKVEIETENYKPVISKTEKLKASIRISNCPEFGEINSEGTIRGRGNYTWEKYPKKPYKIKFGEKQAPFAFNANKDWVLLADYCDRSLLRTAYMCEVSKAVGMDFYPEYQHVDLFLNKEYLGTYSFVDFVEKAKNRINIEKDGFIIQCDNRYKEEPLYFASSIELPSSIRYGGIAFTQYFTFKYPDADDGDIVEGDENYEFITSFMHSTENALTKLIDDPKDTSFQDYIDVKSFAKWFIATEITANYDPNYYFVLNTKQSKLCMYPLWDSEWSMGLWSLNWGVTPSNMVENEVVNNMLYFPLLLKSPIFVTSLKEEWKKCKDEVASVSSIIDTLSKSLELSQQDNFIRWPEIGNRPNVTFDTWEEEVKYTNTFFYQRCEWVDNYINSL